MNRSLEPFYLRFYHLFIGQGLPERMIRIYIYESFFQAERERELERDKSLRYMLHEPGFSDTFVEILERRMNLELKHTYEGHLVDLWINWRVTTLAPDHRNWGNTVYLT